MNTKKLWQALIDSGAASRDARIGALGADRVRELYKEGKDEEAKKLANTYLNANVSGIMSGAGAMFSIPRIGLLPTLITNTTGVVGGSIGGNVGNYIGEKVDTKFGTKWATPTLSTMGALIGGALGGKAGYKGWHRAHYGKNYGTIRFNRGLAPTTDKLKGFIGDGSEQYVFDGGKDVLKVHVDYPQSTLKGMKEFNDRWTGVRNMMPGQLKLRPKGYVYDTANKQYLPVNAQRKVASTFENSNMLQHQWESFVNKLKTKHGIDEYGNFTRRGRMFGTSDYKPENIGIYKGKPKFIDIDVFEL